MVEEKDKKLTYIKEKKHTKPDKIFILFVRMILFLHSKWW